MRLQNGAATCDRHTLASHRAHHEMTILVWPLNQPLNQPPRMACIPASAAWFLFTDREVLGKRRDKSRPWIITSPLIPNACAEKAGGRKFTSTCAGNMKPSRSIANTIINSQPVVRFTQPNFCEVDKGSRPHPSGSIGHHLKV